MRRAPVRRRDRRRTWRFVVTPVSARRIRVVAAGAVVVVRPCRGCADGRGADRSRAVTGATIPGTARDIRPMPDADAAHVAVADAGIAAAEAAGAEAGSVEATCAEAAGVEAAE